MGIDVASLDCNIDMRLSVALLIETLTKVVAFLLDHWC
jgi:hypothetical protein